ncbi:TniQ family protein [Mycolicibacterium septicum]|nr:TniQ family protein [Mycolicibacterium septicum]
MRVARRWLPLQVQPLEGESIDSWLEASARAMGGTVGTLAAAAKLPATARPPWLMWLQPAQAQLLAAATGVPRESIEAMTLSKYDGAALRLDSESHRLDPNFPFGALSRSRFCPACLRETGGRWQLRWRLGWSFACVKHNCLLVDVCPECGRHQRSTQYYRRSPSPAACRCGHPLVAVSTVRWSVNEPFSWAQRTVDGFIDRGANDFGVFQVYPQPMNEAMAAVRSLANRLLNYAADRKFTITAIEDEATGRDTLIFLSDRARETLNNKAPQRALDVAVSATVALAVLEDTSIGICGDAARWFIAGQNATTGPAEIRSCARDNEISAAIALKARSAEMGPELQLRYRTATTMPYAPSLGQKGIEKKAARLPAAIWPEWASVLLSGRRKTLVLRETLTCATLLVGATIRPFVAVRLLGASESHSVLNQRLWALCDTPYWESTQEGLVRLSDFLERRGGRINYERRRRLDYSSLLNGESWQQQTEEGTNSLLAESSVVAARCYLIERISGSLRLALLSHPELDTKSLTTLVAAFRAGLTPHMVAALDERALSFLVERGVNEPVYWHPPLKLLDGLHFS